MGPLRVSTVLRPDNRVAGPWVGRGLFRLRLGLWSAGSVGVRLVGWRIFCAQVGAYFQARLGSLVCVFIFGRVSGGCLGVVVLARSACGLGWAPVAQAYSC